MQLIQKVVGALADRGKRGLRSHAGRHRIRPGEPYAATSCTYGSEGGGWKSAVEQTVTRWPPTLLTSVGRTEAV